MNKQKRSNYKEEQNEFNTIFIGTESHSALFKETIEKIVSLFELFYSL